MNPDFSELVNYINDHQERDREFRWALGDFLARFAEMKGLYKAISSECGPGFSPSTLSAHRKTALAFPDPGMRAQEMDFAIHVMAARTSDPEVWLEYAVENQCSTRELKEKLVEEGEIKPRASREKPDCQGCIQLGTAGENLRDLLTRRPLDAEEASDVEKWDEVVEAVL